MARTRAAVLDGTARAVEKHGARRASMSDIATLSGIAKGTLYNHFRAKDDVYAATLQAGIESLAEECVTVARDDLADALALAAERLGSHPALRRITGDEPAVRASLTTVGDGAGWDSARTAVRDVLVSAGADSSAASVDCVLRWLTTFVGLTGRDVEQQATVIAAGLPRVLPGQAQLDL